jgi:uncharacterized protein (DUF1015 family)
LADLRPFPALRYTAAAGKLADLVAPPYDVIADEDVARWQDASPFNVSRFTRPGSEYARAADLLTTWLDDGVLREDEPSLYVYQVDFDGRSRRDLVGALRLQAYGDGAVLPHERTHRGPKEDRLALMRATQTAPEPLWFLYDPEGTDLPAALEAATESAPIADFDFQGARHRLWRLQDGGVATAALRDKPVLIADGHHRYETTLAFSEELGGGPDAAARFTPALLSSLADPGLEVLPTHRVLVSGVKVTGGEPAASLQEALDRIDGRVAAAHYDGEQFQVLPLEGELALIELHRQVIDNILGRRPAEGNVLYTRDAAEAVRWVDEGRGVQAFFLPRPDLRQVLALARQGMTLPQKSTYFYPKPPSGMVLHRLDPKRDL